MIKVCFLCHGNICRSPMAEFIMKKILKEHHKENEFDIFSRAVSLEEIGNDIYPPAKRCLKEHSVSFDSREAKRISLDEFISSDYIFIMDSNNLFLLKRLFPNYSMDKVFYLNENGIEDPWYTGDFEQVYKDIYEGICNFLLKLRII